MAKSNYAATSVAISDPALKRALLQHLLERKQESVPDDLVEFLDELRTRPLRDFLALANTRSLRVSISLGGVASSLRHLGNKNDQEALLEYFVKHEASLKMIQRFFSISADRARKLNQSAGNSVSGGRAKMPDPAERDRIHEAWHRLQGDAVLVSERDRMHALHQQFSSHSIRALESVLNEFGSLEKVV